jgi:membrane dipeptidase
MTDRLRCWGQYAAFSILAGVYLSAFVLFLWAIFTLQIPLVIASGVALALLVWIVIKAPVLIMVLFNRAERRGPHPVPEAARRLHDSLFIVDLHADTLMWPRNFLVQDTRGHIDLPRMIEANAALEIFTATTKTPVGMNFRSTPDTLDMITPLIMLQHWPRETWRSLLARTLYMGQRLQGYAEASEGRFQIIETAAQLDAYVREREENRQLAAGILGIQGAQPLEGRLENLDILFNAGFRHIGLTHFFDNETGGSAHGVKKAGLTSFGHDVLQRMEELGMVIDLAHAAPALIDGVLHTATKPIMVSHTGPKGICDSNRTLSDEHIRAVAATGGIIGIGFWKDTVGPGGRDAIVRAIQYIADLTSDAHVALGSDFDGMIVAPFDITGLSEITEALLHAGFGEQAIRNIMGENALRVLRASLPA